MADLPLLDEHGYPALLCADDGSALRQSADGVALVCARCGHRSDEPGAGVLGDGFDVLHRQWGLRGDPHAWQAMRDLVGSEPTPVDEVEVRAAYAAAFARVTGVDLDASEEPNAYLRELDHGGMSGGMVDLRWWRTKGIPLLVARASTRRPRSAGAGEADGARRGRWIRQLAGSVAIWALLLGITGALLGGGGWLLYQRAYGTRTEATVVACRGSGGSFGRYGSGYRTSCIAEWTIGGETVVGDYEGGGGSGDVGKTVDVTVRGDTAYARSLGLPILLLVLGIPCLAYVVYAMTDVVRDRRERREHPTAG